MQIEKSARTARWSVLQISRTNFGSMIVILIKKNLKFEKPKPARWPSGLIFWLMKIGIRGTTPHRLKRFKEGSATT
jgi:hypothetical protein